MKAIENISPKRFKYSTVEIAKYMNEFLDMYIEKLDNIGASHMVFISAPMSKVPNYEERFVEARDIITEYFNAANPEGSIHIIGADEIFKDVDPKIDDQLTYIDRLILDYELINYAGYMVLDNRTDVWEASRGCLGELTYAYSNNITVDKLTDFMIKDDDKK